MLSYNDFQATTYSYLQNERRPYKTVKCSDTTSYRPHQEKDSFVALKQPNHRPANQVMKLYLPREVHWLSGKCQT